MQRSEQTSHTHTSCGLWRSPLALFLLNLRFHICQFLRVVICLGELGEENNCLTPLQLHDQGVWREVLSLICAYRHQGEAVMSSARACVVSDGRSDRVILWVWQTQVPCFMFTNTITQQQILHHATGGLNAFLGSNLHKSPIVHSAEVILLVCFRMSSNL